MDLETALTDIASGKAMPSQPDVALIEANRFIFGYAAIDPNPGGLPAYAAARAHNEREFWSRAELLCPVSRARAVENIRNDYKGILRSF